jgi:poly(A) polymerase
MNESKNHGTNNRKYPSARSRRRKPGQRSNHESHLKDMGNVQLEQAVRELNFFEGFEKQKHQKNHRTFALEYLEGILGRWCRIVEEAKRTQMQQQEQEKQPSAPPSFAAVAASGSAASQPPKMSFAAVVAPPKPNVWQRPPPSVLGKDSNATPTKPAPSIPIAALIPFGSYRLGVHSTTSDLDLLTLAPPYVNRSDFFSSLVKLFQEDERCLQVHPIPTAYTPVIKFVLDCSCGDEGQKKMLQIDLVFARVADATKLLEYQRLKVARKQQGNEWNTQSPVEYLLDDSDLQDLDEAGVRSLNGARVSQMLLESVQDVAKFQMVLCAVKQWAVARGVYSNVLGFLGGINWAILVAWVCKHHPNECVSRTLQIFFATFAKWNWNTPVMLTDMVADTPPITNVSQQTRAVKLPAWNPQTNPRDGLHVMPIITPAYPSMNSSYNVDYPQLRRIRDEMVRTRNMFESHKRSKDNVYRHLFTPSDFFECHKHFLQINIRADNKQDFVEWFRLVESKFRVLISTLETTEVHAWPFARFFTKPKASVPEGVTDEVLEKCFFIGLRFAPEIDTVDVRHLTMDFLYKVNSWEGRKSTMDLSIAHITDEDLPLFVWEAMNDHDSRRDINKYGAERSVSSENTAPSTDNDDEDDSCHSVAPNESLPDLASPPKKCRVACRAA